MRRILVLVLSLGVVSCGGDDDGGSPTSPTTPVSTTRVIGQGTFNLGAPSATSSFFGLATITDPANGTWEATVDWTFASNTLFMYVANGACTVEQFASDPCPDLPSCPCQFAVRSEVPAPKPRVLAIPNAAGGTRTLIVWNQGPREESGTYVVRLTTTSGTSSSSFGALLGAGAGSGSGSISVAPKPLR
jgi:hypothetical protein